MQSMGHSMSKSANISSSVGVKDTLIKGLSTSSSASSFMSPSDLHSSSSSSSSSFSTSSSSSSSSSSSCPLSSSSAVPPSCTNTSLKPENVFSLLYDNSTPSGSSIISDYDRELFARTNNSLLFGEISGSNLEKLLDEQHLHVKASDVFYDLGMGLGKISMHCFLQYPHLQHVLGVEFCPSRYAIAKQAAATLHSKVLGRYYFLTKQDLQSLAQRHKTKTGIVGTGTAADDLEEEKWHGGMIHVTDELLRIALNASDVRIEELHVLLEKKTNRLLELRRMDICHLSVDILRACSCINLNVSFTARESVATNELDYLLSALPCNTRVAVYNAMAISRLKSEFIMFGQPVSYLTFFRKISESSDLRLALKKVEQAGEDEDREANGQDDTEEKGEEEK